MLQMHYWNSFDSIDGSPSAVLATSVTVTEGTPMREAFPVTMNVAEFSDAPGVPQYCLTYFCELKHPDGALYELWDDGNGGTRPVDVGDLRFSGGTSCPSGRHQIGGIVTAKAASVQLRLDDGRTFEIPTVPTPRAGTSPIERSGRS